MAKKDKDKKPNKSGNPLFDPTDSNPDPITGKPGAHPIGTGIGAAGAGAVGATVGGVVGGPVGAVVGSVVGAAVGGLMGKGAAEKVNPTVENDYWRENYQSRSYVQKNEPYETYQPAYQAGYEGYTRHGSSGKPYDEIEPDLRQDYEVHHAGGSGLSWDQAKHAVRDAWERVENAVPGKDDDRTHSQDLDRITLHEERLVADKHREKAGEVKLGKHIETETTRVSVPIEKERVVIERVASTEAGQSIAPGEAQFGTTEPVRMEVYEEAADIHKEAFIREEVKVKKVVDREVVDVEEQIRHEELDLNTEGRAIIDQQAHQ